MAFLRFSQRFGKAPIKSQIQTDTMDEDLRNGLWNAFCVFYLEPIREHVTYQIGSQDDFRSSRYYDFFQLLWQWFFKKPIDTLSPSYRTVHKGTKEWFFKCTPYRVLDFIEFVPTIQSPTDSRKFRAFCNHVLESELSAYRFVGEQLAPITNEAELQAVTDALSAGAKSRFEPVHEHVRAAVRLMSDRKAPDHRNSIKESISAVESMAAILSGSKKADLGEALNALDAKIGLHPALKKGYLSIYGWTCDAGIRHGLMKDPNCDFDDAKYMLVSCSAFVNYLMMKAKKAGII